MLRLRTMKLCRFLFVYMLTLSCATLSGQAVVSPPAGAYFGQTPLADAPRMFAPGVVSRQYQELNAAFSPDGSTFFFTIADAPRTHYTLVLTERSTTGEWSPLAVAPFSGTYADADPTFSPDGKRLYFISKRPRVGAPATAKDFNLWYVERHGSGWGEPVDLGPDVNTPVDDFYVSVTRDGVIYWSRNNKIVRAVPDGSNFRVEELPEIVNAPKTVQLDPFVAADESYVIFGSYGRPDKSDSVDLYISFRIEGRWQEPKSLGPTINSSAFEYCPAVSPDGKHFFFTSYRVSEQAKPNGRRELPQIVSDLDKIENGLGNVYWMRTDFIEKMRQEATAGAKSAP